MLGVGFEPTRANTRDLKSPPLDHSGIQAHGTVIVIIILLIIFLLFNDLCSIRQNLPWFLMKPFDIIYNSLSHTYSNIFICI